MNHFRRLPEKKHISNWLQVLGIIYFIFMVLMPLVIVIFCVWSIFSSEIPLRLIHNSTENIRFKIVNFLNSPEMLFISIWSGAVLLLISLLVLSARISIRYYHKKKDI